MKILAQNNGKALLSMSKKEWEIVAKTHGLKKEAAMPKWLGGKGGKSSEDAKFDSVLKNVNQAASMLNNSIPIMQDLAKNSPQHKDYYNKLLNSITTTYEYWSKSLVDSGLIAAPEAGSTSITAAQEAQWIKAIQSGKVTSVGRNIPVEARTEKVMAAWNEYSKGKAGTPAAETPAAGTPAAGTKPLSEVDKYVQDIKNGAITNMLSVPKHLRTNQAIDAALKAKRVKTDFGREDVEGKDIKFPEKGKNVGKKSEPAGVRASNKILNNKLSFVLSQKMAK